MHYPTFLPALVLLGVLGACTDRQATTAPDAGSTLDVAAPPADLTDTDLATGEELVLPPMLRASSRLIASPKVAAGVATERAATGGRATGHVDITSGSVGQQYSFSALSTGDFPNAKGQSEGHFNGPILGRAIVHANVDCLAITGNNAWLSGPITKFRSNGQDVPFPPGLQVVVRVRDNGEGGTTVDEASLGVGVVGTQVCRSMPPLPLLPIDNGNIEVSQR